MIFEILVQENELAQPYIFLLHLVHDTYDSLVFWVSIVSAYHKLQKLLTDRLSMLPHIYGTVQLVSMSVKLM